MLQHQIAQSPARLGLTGPGSPSVQNPTPPRHGHPTSSSSSQSHQDAKQKVAREIKSKDSSLLAFAKKLKEAERVLDMLVDDYYNDYRKPKRSKTQNESQKEEESDNESSSSSSSSTTVSSQLKLMDILAYAHKISYTTFAPPEFGAGQAPPRGALPPAPQDEQMRASQLYTFADLDIGLPKTVENMDKKVEALIEPPPPPSEAMDLHNLLPPNISVPSGWKPGIPVNLLKDLPLPPPRWKPGDPVVLPPLKSIAAPRAEDQPHMVREVQLDIGEEDDGSDCSSDDMSSDAEE